MWDCDDVKTYLCYEIAGEYWLKSEKTQSKLAYCEKGYFLDAVI